jgi:hypothetical protein
VAFPHSRPPLPFSPWLQFLSSSRGPRPGKSTSKRVKDGFLPITGEVYQRYAEITIMLIIVRGMSRPCRSVFTPKRH